jgi:hypothetical protein
VRSFSRTSQFKKDVKRAARRGNDMAKLHGPQKAQKAQKRGGISATEKTEDICGFWGRAIVSLGGVAMTWGEGYGDTSTFARGLGATGRRGYR